MPGSGRSPTSSHKQHEKPQFSAAQRRFFPL